MQQYGLSNAAIDVFALLGMAALFAGSARAPLTAIIMTSEMVNDFQLITPLMLTVVTAWMISSFLLQDDIYTLKLKRRGVQFTPAVDVLEEVPVREIMIIDPVTVSPFDRIEHVIELMMQTSHTGYPVIGEEGELVGIITEHDVDRAIMRHHIKEWAVADVCSTDIITIHPDDTLTEAMLSMARNKVNRLPVVDRETNKLVGWITRSDLMKLYLEKKSKTKVDEFEMELLDRL